MFWRVCVFVRKVVINNEPIDLRPKLKFTED